MWQLLALAVIGVVKLFDALADPRGSTGASRPPRSDFSERTQNVEGYVRRDGTCVRGYQRRPPRG
jgi:hypothetical protein